LQIICKGEKVVSPRTPKEVIFFTQCQNLDVRLKAIANFVRAALNCCCLHYPCHSARVILLVDGPQHQIIPKSRKKCKYHSYAVLEAICCGCLHATVHCPFTVLCAQEICCHGLSSSVIMNSAKVVLIDDSRPWLFAHLANFLNSS